MAVLDRIRANRFVLIGRAGLDLYPHPPGARTEDAAFMQTALGGSSANIAAGLCRLGAAASLVTCVSDDAVGRFTVNQLRAYGIGTEGVRAVRGEWRTSLALAESRIEDHQSVIYRNLAADFQMDRSDVEAIDFASAGALVATGTVFALEPSRAAGFRAFELARAAGVPVILDLDYRPYSWASRAEAAATMAAAAEAADVVVGNDEEFAILDHPGSDGLAAAQRLAGGRGALAIHKMGERGCVTFTADRRFETGIYPTAALKPTGAGDAFLSATLASLARGMPLEAAIERGAASAAIVVGRVGCAPAMPDRAELEAFLAERGAPVTSKGSTDAHSSP